MGKNILVIAGSSDILFQSIILLLGKGWSVYATSRQTINYEHINLHKFRLDVCDLKSFEALEDSLSNVKFDAIIYGAGCVVSSPVENLDEDELRRQLDVNLFGFLRLIKLFSNKLNTNARIINLSSMAAYGLFPFISPYCLSKAASDILLRSFSLESGFKYVSIRPGAIKTKFWEQSICDNENNFKNFGDKFKKQGEFLLSNARKNSMNAISPKLVAKAIYRAVSANNPKPIVTVGYDAFVCAMAARFFPTNILDFIIKSVLRLKLK